MVAENLDSPEDLNSLSRTSRFFHHTLNPILYKPETFQQKPLPCLGYDYANCHHFGVMDKDNWIFLPTKRRCKPAEGWGKFTKIPVIFLKPLRCFDALQCLDTAFDWAIKNDRPATVARLLTNGASVETRLLGTGAAKWYVEELSNPTPLISAVSLGKTTMVKALLEMGANVNAKVEEGATALHAAVMEYGSGEILEESAALVRLLLDAGAEVDSFAGSFRGTPLAVASYVGNIPAMHLLLAHCAKTESNGRWGTILDGAVRRNQ